MPFFRTPPYYESPFPLLHSPQLLGISTASLLLSADRDAPIREQNRAQLRSRLQDRLAGETEVLGQNKQLRTRARAFMERLASNYTHDQDELWKHELGELIGSYGDIFEELRKLGSETGVGTRGMAV